ncbi:MAG: cysteine--tRNA ligase [Alphaproteobacteria bacterium]
MEINIYDSLTRKKREFVPIKKDDVRIYACGPTVYDYAHIGNARMSVVTDLLVRVLRTKFSNVKFVSNITDIDDKIIEASLLQKKSIQEITEKFHKIYNNDMQRIGVQAPDNQPKATQHIKEMISMIQKLLENNCAYVTESHVIFDIKKYKFYGCLSGRLSDQQIGGNRIEVAEFKKNSGDFILWKPSKLNEPSWDSPWGKGRPGWHIECSAMAEKCLGSPFDIHCGGVDLTFPHHENEIAQSCSIKNINSDPETFSKYWFHNGFVTVNGEKMSKSLGNITLVNELLKNYSGDVVRYSLLTSHYRQPLDWSKTILEQSKKTLEKFKKIIDDCNLEKDIFRKYSDEKYINNFLYDLYDDLNTPRAFATLNSWIDKIKKKSESKETIISFIKCLEILGINLNKDRYKNKKIDKSEEEVIIKLIENRDNARKNKDFEKADEIRDKLKELNISIEDSEDGTKWKKNN